MASKGSGSPAAPEQPPNSWHWASEAEVEAMRLGSHLSFLFDNRHCDNTNLPAICKVRTSAGGSPDTTILLCVPCNSTHKNSNKYWTNYFKHHLRY